MYSIFIIQIIIFILLNILNNIHLINCDNENEIITSLADHHIDPNGYVVYCPCMGRFGNQADHFLGSLGFARAINRTLILPAWVEYRKGSVSSQQIPFDKYFQIEPLRKYHRVITMETFMNELAATIWPPHKRIAFCYTARPSLTQNTAAGCNAKEGNPFRSFWDNYNVDFIGSEYYQPLSYDVYYGRNVVKTWSDKYPSDQWPVLAFVGAPAVFPVQQENVHLHKYLHWSDNLNKMAKHFIKQYLPKGAFIGIHLRNGIDWVRACGHIESSPLLFSAPQCLGYRSENGNATQEMCMPTNDLIIKQLKREIKKFNELNPKNEIKSIFVASDSHHMINELNTGLARMEIKAYRTGDADPHIDMIILGWSNYFIGNCISSYTAFVKRERDARGFKSGFWAYPSMKSNNHKYAEEL